MYVLAAEVDNKKNARPFIDRWMVAGPEQDPQNTEHNKVGLSVLISG